MGSIYIQPFLVTLPFEEFVFNEVPCGAICAVTLPDVVPTCAYTDRLILVNVEVIPKVSVNAIAIARISFITQVCI
jgi:hypothetical protein